MWKQPYTDKLTLYVCLKHTHKRGTLKEIIIISLLSTLLSSQSFFALQCFCCVWVFVCTCVWWLPVTVTVQRDNRTLSLCFVFFPHRFIKKSRRSINALNVSARSPIHGFTLMSVFNLLTLFWGIATLYCSDLYRLTSQTHPQFQLVNFTQDAI